MVEQEKGIIFKINTSFRSMDLECQIRERPGRVWWTVKGRIKRLQPGKNRSASARKFIVYSK